MLNESSTQGAVQRVTSEASRIGRRGKRVLRDEAILFRSCDVEIAAQTSLAMTFAAAKNSKWGFSRG
jgi:hypothetical protein